MKGEHCEKCVIDFTTCKCNSCKNDSNSIISCCFHTWGSELCPVENCPDYEPDDEEDDHA